jgi:hypothetical protein
LRCRIFLVRKTSKVSVSIPAFCRQRRGEERGGRDEIFLGRLLGGLVKSHRRFFLGLLRGRIECQICRFYLQDFMSEGFLY